MGDGGCAPLAGDPGSACDPAQMFIPTLALSGVTTQPTFTAERFVADITRVAPGRIDLTRDDGTTHTLDYDLGPFEPPVAVGDRVDVDWRQVAPFGIARGVALRTPEGRLLLAVDDGAFGSAWSDQHGSEKPDGFEVLSQPAGCAMSAEQCHVSMPTALAFSHPSGAHVTVLPGESSLLEVGGGQVFRVVNAFTERLLEVGCTDQSARQAWIILAEDGSP